MSSTTETPRRRPRQRPHALDERLAATLQSATLDLVPMQLAAMPQRQGHYFITLRLQFNERTTRSHEEMEKVAQRVITLAEEAGIKDIISLPGNGASAINLAINVQPFVSKETDAALHIITEDKKTSETKRTFRLDQTSSEKALAEASKVMAADPYIRNIQQFASTFIGEVKHDVTARSVRHHSYY